MNRTHHGTGRTRRRVLLSLILCSLALAGCLSHLMHSSRVSVQVKVVGAPLGHLLVRLESKGTTGDTLHRGSESGSNTVTFADVPSGAAVQLTISGTTGSFSDWHYFRKTYMASKGLTIPVTLPTNSVQLAVDFGDLAVPSSSVISQQLVARVEREDTYVGYGYRVWVKMVPLSTPGVYSGAVPRPPDGQLEVSFVKADLSSSGVHYSYLYPNRISFSAPTVHVHPRR